MTYPGQDAPGSERDRRLLRNWLLALPKPAALLAEHDIRAAQVLELCKEADISVYTLPVYKAKKPDEDTSVFGEEIFLAVPDNDEFRDIDDVDLYDVRGQEFISLAGSKQFRAICDSFCVAAGFKPNIVFESDSPKMVREMIEMGFGIGFWPEYSWGDVVGEKIKLLPITYPVCKRDIIVSCDLTAHSGNDEIVQELKDHIVDCFNNRKK